MPSIRLVIDLHGADLTRPFNIDIGTGGDQLNHTSLDVGTKLWAPNGIPYQDDDGNVIYVQIYSCSDNDEIYFSDSCDDDGLPGCGGECISACDVNCQGGTWEDSQKINDNIFHINEINIKCSIKINEFAIFIV